MEPQGQEYKGHRIELRRSKTETLRQAQDQTEAEPELLIDGQPVRYMQLPDGSYALYEYAYDWTTDLMDLARRFIDYRIAVDNVRRGRTRKEQ